jgi:putative ABC transport system substrate-binding protein
LGVSDPVASGIVARLDRPSGNITGFGQFEASTGGKWLELLSEIAPGLKRAAIMFNPATAPASTFMPSLECKKSAPKGRHVAAIAVRCPQAASEAIDMTAAVHLQGLLV